MLLALAASSYLWLNIPAISSFCKSELPKGLCIAYISRRYKQGKTKSYYQLNLSDFTGKRQSQITFGRQDVEDYFWQDNNHLIVLLSNSRNIPWTADANYELVRINTASRRQTRLKSWSSKQDTVSVDGSKNLLHCENKDFKIKTNSVIRIKNPPKNTQFSAHAYLDEDELSETNRMLWEDLGLKDKSIRFAELSEDYSDIRLVFDRAKGQSVSPPGFTYQDAYRIGNDDIILVTKDPSRPPELFYVTYVNTKYVRSLTFISGYSDVEFDVKERIWFGSETDNDKRYDLLKDGRTVIVRAIYAGDWKTGRVWPIDRGLVYAYQPSLRPI